MWQINGIFIFFIIIIINKCMHELTPFPLAVGDLGTRLTLTIIFFLRDFCSIYASVASFAIYVNNLPS